MPVGLKVDGDSFNKMVQVMWVDALRDRLRSSIRQIRKGVRDVLRDHISHDPTFISLSIPSSQLRGELGIPPDIDVAEIVQTIIDGVDVTLDVPPTKRPGLGVKMKLTIRAVQLNELMNHASAIVYSTKGTPWNWLAALLDEGLEVSGWYVREANAFERSYISRSGSHIMEERAGTHWRLDSTHAQFIERITSEDMAQSIMKVVIRELK